MSQSPPAPSAVRLYAPDHPALVLTMRGRLERRRKELLEEVWSAKDWADFQRHKGRIEQIDWDIQECTNVEGEMNRADR